MNREEFIKELKKINIELNDEQIKSLDLYAEYLLEENKITNLTAIRDLEGVYLKHFYDSLTLALVVDIKEIDNLLDIGTGAGFPGMVLKIVYPHLNVTLLDSNNKKLNFLRNLKEKLSLTNVEIIHDRAEEFIRDNREKFDVVTARAVSNLSVLAELAIPFVKEGKYFIPLKGSNEEEIKEAEYAIEFLGGQIENITKIELPHEEGTRNIIKVIKIKKTMSKYPRRYDKITKNPLKK